MMQSLLPEYSIIPVLWQLQMLVSHQKHSAPRFCRAALLLTHSLQLKHGLFSKVFADTQYQLAPHPISIGPPLGHLLLHFVLFHLLYLRSASNILLLFMYLLPVAPYM